ncbi:MAG TPA: hypothetical protein VGO61_01115 [Steroidobacteraceae bacterium]|jgi:hypothetical protein|nr:hypothetical protein [Steroidobacteraceae bacterium]
MVQQILVAVIVCIAFAASAWKLMSARRRLRVLLALDAWAARHPRLSPWRERSLKPRIARAAGTGCAGCAANVGIKPHQPPR